MSEAKSEPFFDRAAKTLQNKVVDGGVADPRHQIILPANTTDNLSAPGFAPGSIAYDTTKNGVVVNNGSGFVDISPAAGANTTLSNLTAPVATNQDISPATDFGQNLGSTHPFNEVSSQVLALYATSTSEAVVLAATTSTTIGPLTNVTGYVDQPVAGSFAIFTEGDSNADANPTGGIVLLTGDKTGGTGNSGDIVFQTGASSGGGVGVVRVADSTTFVANSITSNNTTLNITTPNHTTGGGTGPDLDLTAGDWTSGSGGAPSHVGGNVNITSGGGNHRPGSVNIRGGQATLASGDVNITTQSANTGASSGQVSIQTGNSDTSVGTVALQSGTATSAANGGNISLTAGNADSGNGGNLNLTAGTSNSGTPGVINMTAMVLNLPTGTADPSGGFQEGSIYYNTTSHAIRWYNGTAWASLA